MDASLTKTGPRYTLGLERRLAHSPEKVWRVLTERDLLNQWFPCDVEGEWKVGSELRFNFLHGEGEGLPEEDLRGEVLVLDPPRLLEYRWGTHLLRCELTADGDGCRLLFSESFEDASWGARNAAGWEMCLDNLELLVQGQSGAGTHGEFPDPFDRVDAVRRQRKQRRQETASGPDFQHRVVGRRVENGEVQGLK